MRLTTQQHAAVARARQAMAASLSDAGFEAEAFVAIAVCTITTAFADLVTASDGDPALLTEVNRALRSCGLQIAPLAA